MASHWVKALTEKWERSERDTKDFGMQLVEPSAVRDKTQYVRVSELIQNNGL